MVCLLLPARGENALWQVNPGPSAQRYTRPARRAYRWAVRRGLLRDHQSRRDGYEVMGNRSEGVVSKRLHLVENLSIVDEAAEKKMRTD